MGTAKREHRRRRISRRWASALAVGLTIATLGVVGPQEPADAAPCPTYWVIGVRGSGEGFVGPYGMGDTVGTYAQAAAGNLPGATTQFNSLAYPAAEVGPGYLESVVQGWSILLSNIRSKISQCPSTRIGLIGYSQGAHVVNEALHRLTSRELGYVRAVLQIADPRSDPTTPYHLATTIFGDPPPRPTRGGVMTRQTLPAAVHSRAVDFCFVNDLVCDAPSAGGLAALIEAVTLSFHTGYRTCCNSFNWVSILGSSFATGMKAAWTPPGPPNPPPNPPPSTRYWVDTFANASVYASATSTTATGTLYMGTNYVYCKVWGREIRDSAGNYNHWWLKTDPDVGPANQYVSAYYLTRWGNDVAKDNNGTVIPNCPATRYWVDTFANASVYASPTSTTATGTLYMGTNYVYCKVWGREIRDSAGNYNHWWLKTDPDVGPANQYVSAYYLTRWGNDVAKDNNGTVIPNC